MIRRWILSAFLFLVCFAHAGAQRNIDAQTAPPSGTTPQSVKESSRAASVRPRAYARKSYKATASVAINRETGVYYCQGTADFETYKSAGIATQKVAIDQGFRPAFGKLCQ
jgi:hypothetical protein